jgi:hypothetical protein
MDGGYIVTGETMSFGSGAVDILILKLDPKGEIEWQQVYGGKEDDIARCIHQTTDGRYILAGFTNSFGLGADDILILRLNMKGLTDQNCKLGGKADVEVTNPFIRPADTPSKAKETKSKPKVTDIKPQDSHSIAFNFCELKRILHIEAEHGGTTKPPPGLHLYLLKSDVTIEAIPDNNFYFSHWSGDITAYGNPITITMDSHKSIKAHFSYPGSGGGYGEEWGGGGGDWDFGPCFIATAAYGSSVHPHVKVLRDFRDTYLMSNKIGRDIVGFYYKHSPCVANLIEKYKPLGFIARISLLPFVALSYSLVNWGPLITAILIGFIFSLPVSIIHLCKKRRMRKGRITTI